MTSPLVTQLVNDIQDLKNEKTCYYINICSDMQSIYSLIIDDLNKLHDILSAKFTLNNFEGSILEIFKIDDELLSKLIETLNSNPEYEIYRFNEICIYHFRLDCGADYIYSLHLDVMKLKMNQGSINLNDISFHKDGQPFLDTDYFKKPFIRWGT